MKKKITHTDKTTNDKKDRLKSKSRETTGKSTKEDIIRRGRESKNIKDIRLKNMTAKKAARDDNFSSGKSINDEISMKLNRNSGVKDSKKMDISDKDKLTEILMDFDLRKSKTIKTKSASPNKLDFLKHQTINKLEGR